MRNSSQQSMRNGPPEFKARYRPKTSSTEQGNKCPTSIGHATAGGHFGMVGFLHGRTAIEFSENIASAAHFVVNDFPRTPYRSRLHRSFPSRHGVLRILRHGS